MKNPIRKISKFGSEVIDELKKSSWPKKVELIESTIIVIIGCLMLAGFVAICDIIYKYCITKIM